MKPQKYCLLFVLLIIVTSHSVLHAGAGSGFVIPNLPVVAHRGFSKAYPENTVVAAKGAIEAKAEGCEFDVRATADRVIIVLHDESLNRTTNVKSETVNGKPRPVRAKELTFDEIRKLDAGSWFDPQFAGEKIPTIDEMLAVLKESKCWPIVEIKEDGIEEQVVTAIKKAGLADRCVIITFSKNSVKKIRQLEPEIPVAWLWGEKWEKGDDALCEMLTKEANAIDTKLLDLSYKNISPSVVTRLINQGITVWAWTVDEPTEMKKLRENGIVSITSNRPDVARP